MGFGKKVALITGTGSGVGRACASALGEAGYAVVLAGRRREPLEALAVEMGSPALAVPTDVSDADTVRALFERVEASFERLDVLFNNAGTNTSGYSLEDLPPQQWRAVVDVNLTGAFFCTQAAFKLMQRQTPPPPAVGASLTMGPFPRIHHGQGRWPIPPPSTRSPA